jgi:hypothetical protein
MIRAIYEGAFSFDDVRIRADVLDKLSEGKFESGGAYDLEALFTAADVTET